MNDARKEKKQRKVSSRPSIFEEKQQKLLQLLRSGLGVVSQLWTYSTNGWVTSVYAADIDNDGDIEIIIGSHDGSVRALTTNGNKKWEAQLGQRISAIAVISQSEKTRPSDPRVIVGSREGRVSALDQNGNVIQDWQYEINKGINQIYIDPNTPERVIIGAEDHYVYVLDTTGNCLWKYETQDQVLCVFSYDVDNDKEQEVLAGSRDKHVYILSANGTLKGTCNTEYKVYSVSATRLSNQEEEPVTILTSTNGKDLCGWTMVEQPDPYTKQHWLQTWQQKNPDDILYENRLHAIQAEDINRDGKLEILVGSEDKHLYILDHQGNLLWRHDVGYSIHSLYAIDFNYDGITEVILGLEDNNVHVLRIELVPDLYQAIRKQYKAIKKQVAINRAQGNNTNTILKVNTNISNLGLPNPGEKDSLDNLIYTLWQSQPETNSVLPFLMDLLGKQENPQPWGSMELAVAELYKKRGEYEAALTILQMLRETQVQHCWPHPRSNLGHIPWLAFGDVLHDPTDEIIGGNENGVISALDIKLQDEQKALLWQYHLEKPLLALQMGRTNYHDFDTIYTVLANHRICVLKSDGTLMPDHEPTLRVENDDSSLEGDDIAGMDATPNHGPEENPHSEVSHYQIDQVCSLYLDIDDTSEVNKIREIILGLTNNKICICDDSLKECCATIHTEAAIKLICAHDINGDGEAEIIFGSVNHQIYAYTRNGVKLWSYPTQDSYPIQDHVRAIRAKDVDKDGYAEIIIGSEDRNVYVLDWQGQLKWRYYAPHRILDVDICDLDGKGEYSILLGVADGYMYVLNSEGDLQWTYKTNGRVYAVRAKDLNDDKQVEIALASEDRLELLQVGLANKRESLIEECWDELKKQRWDKRDETYWKSINPVYWKELEEKHNFEDLKRILHEYAQPNQNEYLRSFALGRLAGQKHAGQSDFDTKDFKVFHEALKSNSLIIKKSLVRVVANLCMSGNTKKEVRVRAQVRDLLQQLFQDPNREVRLAIVRMLTIALVDSDQALGFEYLERFKNNADVWVRRTLVRNLSHLCKKYPEPTFRLLYMMAKDEHSWIRQETGRTLAHYFDLNTSELINGSHQLLAEKIDATVLAQIASSSKESIVKQYYTLLAQLLQDPLNTKHLDELLAVLDTAQEQEIVYSQQTQLIYQELRQLLTVKNVNDIQFYRITTNKELVTQIARLAHLKWVFEGISKVIKSIEAYHRRESLSDRVISLIEAIFEIDDIDKAIDNVVIRTPPTESPISQSFEDSIIVTILVNWRKIIMDELGLVRGPAKLKVELKDNVSYYEEQMVISFSISNQGQSPAENIRILLQEDQHFEIIGENQHHIKEVTKFKTSSFSFTIKPKTDRSLQPLLTIIYNDGHQKNKKIRFSDRIEVRTLSIIDHGFKEIPSPYNSGTPIQDETMFYGRKADLEFLRDVLISTGNNRVVVLTGQRRSGKTSLIYQLTRWLGPHVPVFIDMQSLSLKSGVPQLLHGFASSIDEALAKEQETELPIPDAQEFENDPTQVFGKYLEAVTQKLMTEGKRLVLLIDEFEALEKKFADKQLDHNFLQYLRSLIQHHQGINLLLAGAPVIRQFTEEYWAVFFNTTQHWKLSKLSQDDAERLIKEPVPLEYDPLAIEKMHYLTGDQPYFIHMMGDALIRHCNTKQKRYVTINDVNTTIDAVLEAGNNHFGWIRNQITPDQRFLLSLLAQEKDEDSLGHTLSDIQEGYKRQGILFESDKVLASLDHLVKEDILEEHQRRTKFRIPVGFIREWWNRNFPIERVLLEENF